MRSTTSVTVDSFLLAEARGVGLSMSAILEEALREKLKKSVSPEDKVIMSLKKLKELKISAYNLAQLKRAEFKLAVRKARFLGLQTETIEDKVKFWEQVIAMVENNEFSQQKL